MLELYEKAAQVNREINEFGTDGLVESIREIMSTYPAVKAVTWRQYTPGFNDGDPCEFSVCGKGVLVDKKVLGLNKIQKEYTFSKGSFYEDFESDLVTDSEVHEYIESEVEDFADEDSEDLTEIERLLYKEHEDLEWVSFQIPNDFSGDKSSDLYRIANFFSSMFSPEMEYLLEKFGDGKSITITATEAVEDDYDCGY